MNVEVKGKIRPYKYETEDKKVYTLGVYVQESGEINILDPGYERPEFSEERYKPVIIPQWMIDEMPFKQALLLRRNLYEKHIKKSICFHNGDHIFNERFHAGQPELVFVSCNLYGKPWCSPLYGLSGWLDILKKELSFDSSFFC